ncbi:aldehyde dehydrogenase family protein [Phytomonospora endophytica]|uniref:Acyl-CoA reductase-like NAD-dependent aldehyde dehydrogenase n=1 Tax=Phytomonospora endophytica TaxID=714109 RepID=A0A841FRT6_9ACTN|nr:aldehyde dehydrogenase family protein [Phytomonospora endophytica]MBB6036478.1 acyl-CoA reductase-like NAD-dependent aldehyde dehydrogenase [Phytomonospora endophytica]GIG65800.1 phenylacetaldehyde dehydrogenase [Phytomonospora endophytica]
MQRIVNPATGKLITELPGADADAVDDAVWKSRVAYQGWSKVSPGDRARMLRRFAAVVEEHKEELAGLETLNAGHPVSSARWEAGNVADVLAYYAGAPERHVGQQIPVAGGVNITFHESLGVVGIIVPWNFPMAIMMWGAAPALAAGNTVIVKPAEQTPLTALRLAGLALEAGIPEDVLQVVPGEGEVAGARLAGHPDVRKIVFTGSVEVGREVARAAAGSVKRVTLELGGNSANIVFGDADIRKAAASAPYAVFDNAGQDCCARSRILVQRDVYDEFRELFTEALRTVKVGDPALDTTEMGPLISAEHRERVRGYLKREPDVVGECPEGEGFWMPASAYFDVAEDDPLWTDEVFGPVVAIAPFYDELEAISLANATPYGLSGSIWTGDTGRALRMARAVEGGNLSVNSNSSVRYWTPFGGVKQSGLGRELGPDALDAFTDVKNVFIAND